MRFKPVALLRFRPRFLTLALLIIVAATIVLANLSFDFGDLGLFPRDWLIVRHKSYGWPLIWHRYVFFDSGASTIKTVGWYYSPTRLAANLAIWLGIAAASAVVSEWRLRRQPLRLRWNLRAMLAAVALAAAFCAWFVAARDRANLQEPLVAAIAARGGHVFFDRWGPKWLDLFGGDPFRRRIIGAELRTQRSTSVKGRVAEAEDAAEADFLKRLAQLPDLQYLIMDTDYPEIAAVLDKMRRLRVLSIESQHGGSSPDPEEQWFSDHCLAAIGEMTQLEELHLHGMGIDSRQLSRLAPLSKLRFLSLEFLANSYGPDFATVRLDQLPPLPQLEAIDLTGTHFSDRDLHHLASFPRLRKLNLSIVDLTDAGMGELASLASLEELAIDVLPSSPSWLESLLALKRLRRLHIPSYFRGNDTQAKLPIDTPEQAPTYTGMAGGDHPPVKLPLADGGEVFVPEADLKDCRRVLNALRQSNSRIVIDVDEHALSWFRRGYQLLREHDTEVNRRADWLPTSGYRWVAPAMRTQLEAYAELHGVSVAF
jgi:hypothetical protein